MTKLRAVLRRRWPLLLAGLLMGALAGVLSSAMAQETAVEASYTVTQLIIANSAASTSSGVEQDALRVTRGDVARSAATALGETGSGNFGSLVSAEADLDTNTIAVSSTNVDPELATRRVSAFVDAFLQSVNGELIAQQEAEVSRYQQRLDEATARLAAFDAANPGLLLPGGSANPFLSSERESLQQEVQSAEQALRDQRNNANRALPYSTLGPDAPVISGSDLIPVPTGAPFRAALLGLFGLALTAGLIMLLERFIPRVDTRDELVAAAELPVLSEVGRLPKRRLPHDLDGTLKLEGAWAEPYRRIRSAIQFVQSTAAPESPARVFMFTSPSPSEGKSTTTAVTALALAEAGQRTLVVGGDFRRPSVHKMLGVQATPGLRDHARLDIGRPAQNEIVHRTSHENLYVAPSGVPSKDVVGMADAARSLIANAAAEGATVVVDTSPVEVANDAVDLLPAVDEVILIVRSGHTSLKSLKHTIEQLQLHGASIMGAVLIGAPGIARQQYYYDGYYTDPANPVGGPPSGPRLVPSDATHNGASVGVPPLGEKQPVVHDAAPPAAASVDIPPPHPWVTG